MHMLQTGFTYTVNVEMRKALVASDRHTESKILSIWNTLRVR